MGNVKYYVELREGKKDEERQEFNAPREAIEEVFKTYSFDRGALGVKHVIEMKHIVFTGNLEDIKQSGRPARAEFIKGRINSLEFHVETEEDANICAEYLKLPPPFHS